MFTPAAATHQVPPALITHSVCALRGAQTGDIAVHHAQSPDARICLTFSGILMVLYSCDAAQGLLEAFTAARGQMTRVPRELPSPRPEHDEPFARTTLSVEWTRRPRYAVSAQSATNKLGNAVVHWAELYTGPLTWQLRDHAGLASTIDILSRVHRTAVAVFPDGPAHAADPTGPDYRTAA